MSWIAQTEVDWSRLDRAMRYYRRLGYRSVDVPWIVPPEATNVTRPPNGEDLIFQLSYGRTLVASAEQSFYELIRTEQLPPGKYVACSPCFRDERVESDAIRHGFMKVELIAWGYVRDRLPLLQDYKWMWGDAVTFLQLEATKLEQEVEPLLTDDGVDLYLNGFEIGSYGLRTAGDVQWVYGTGLAEPRFSVAVQGPL